jgi:hypothetical protein
MAAKKKAAQAGTAAWAAGKTGRPYVQRIAEDEELRGNLLTAYESARKAYGRLTNGKSPAKAVFDDKKLQKDIREAAESIRDASVALREAPQKRKKRRGGLGKLILLAIVGAAVAIAVSEDLRKKLLDALFGAEEEFEYTSTTTSPTDAGQPAGSAS